MIDSALLVKCVVMLEDPPFFQGEKNSLSDEGALALQRAVHVE